MPLKRKYQEELDYLRRLAQVFVRDNPQLARFLGNEANDPDVERLLEGVAFLTAKLRHKIEDDLPELTHSMLQLLWPNYLRPLPSATIMCFEPLLRAITTGKVIPRGTRIASRPVDGVSCTFRTCTDITVLPPSIAGVSDAHTKEKSIMRVDLALPDDRAPGDYDADTLEFHLCGSELNALTLYLWLAQYLGEVRMEFGDTQRHIAPANITFPGFAPQEALLPYPKNAFDGYRMLQEYFMFPKRFHFFRLNGLRALWPREPVDQIRLEFHFTRPMPPDIRLRTADLSLYCTPAVNLFEHNAEPISLTGTAVDQPVVPATQHRDSYEVFSVDDVNGWQSQEGGLPGKWLRTYHAFESLQHEIDHANGQPTLYHRTRIEHALAEGGYRHRIAFVRSDESDYVGQNETISISLTCTNRDLPLSLDPGDICLQADNTPTFATYRNLTAPTPSYRPVLDGQLHWRLISNLSLNYLSLESADSLKAILRAYDFPALYDIQHARTTRKRLDSIVDISTVPVDRLVKGLVIRGMKTELKLDPTGFLCEGDLYLFGTVLSHFFALYTSLSSFHMLEVVNTGNQERYTWPMRIGRQQLM